MGKKLIFFSFNISILRIDQRVVERGKCIKISGKNSINFNSIEQGVKSKSRSVEQYHCQTQRGRDDDSGANGEI